MTWFIPGKSPIKVSTVHRPVVIDHVTGKPACPPCAPGHTYVEVFEFWPSDLQQVFAQAGMPRRTPPQNPECENAGQLVGDPPRITSPLRGSSYAMRMNQTEQARIGFSATADVHTLFWFVNDAFVGRSAPNESVFWQPATAGTTRCA